MAQKNCFALYKNVDYDINDDVDDYNEDDDDDNGSCGGGGNLGFLRAQTC